MDGESAEGREARWRELWGRLDTRKEGRLDRAGLKAGLQSINHPLKDADPLIRDMVSTQPLHSRH